MRNRADDRGDPFPPRTAWGTRFVLFLLVALALPTFAPYSSSGAAWAATLQQDARGDLQRIERWLAADDLDRRAAARRELADRIGLEEITELHGYLARPLAAKVRRPLLAHLHELALAQILDIENAISNFESARRLAQQLAAEVDSLEHSPDAVVESDPDRTGTRSLEELHEELEGRRRTRRQARRRVDEGHAQLRSLGLALAPVLFHRRAAGGIGSPLVERFHRRLWDELVEEASRLYPHAPAEDAIGPHESRSLVPLLPELEPEDPAGWARRRKSTVEEALRAIESLKPEAIVEGRALLLEAGDGVDPFLAAWIERESVLPTDLKRSFLEWNRLRVPPGFERRTALDLGHYSSLSRTQRLDLIHRLEFVGREDAPAVLDGIVRTENEVALKVEAAAVLARLGDPRGAGFLRQLGLEQAIELEAISRRVLLIEALQQREAGDEAGALESLLEILRRFAGDFRLHYEIAFTALRLDRFELSIEHFERAVELDPRDPVTHYNFACALSLAGKLGRALDELEIAVERGFRDKEHYLADEDLIPLRDLPRFQEIIDSI